MKKTLASLVAILLAFGAVTGCDKMNNGTRPVKGTIDQKLGEDRAPHAVSVLLKETEKTPGDERFESILDDKDNKLSVWGLMKCNDSISSEGYGITVVKDGVETDFTNIRHGNSPKALSDKAKLWFVGTPMEGTGVHVEQPYLILFDKERYAHVVATLDPYDMQQELCKRVSYSIEGMDITFYADGNKLTTVTSTTEDMGEFYDDPVWIGEQISYLLGKKLTVIFTPGVSFVTGKVLIYDDMPTFAATVELNNEGFKLSNIRLVGENTPDKPAD